MYLKALEIQGFKSFPDKTVLNFGEDFTAIVGPNGSGKSNLSDAIRWVMGEQSAKGLRGAKMEDVIFGGTQKRRQVGFAQVSLILDNTERIFPNMEESEVSVTRRYYRSGESEYYINRQSVRLKDVTELFMDTGLGREGYSMIGQGKIDEILSVKGGERREIFEEAAGISKFRHRKEETERKLERTGENLLRVNDKIVELEPRVESLKSQAETAKKYLILRDELRLLEISVWLSQLDALKDGSIKIESDFHAAEQEREQVRAELDDIYAQGEKFGEAIREKDIAAEKIRAESAATESLYRDAAAAVAVLESQIEHQKENIARAEDELKENMGRAGNLSRDADEQEKKSEILDIDIKNKNKNLENLLERSREMTQKAGGRQSELDALRKQEADALSESAFYQSKAAGVAAENEQIDGRRLIVLSEKDKISGQLKSTKQEADENQKALLSTRDEIKSAANKISGHKLRIADREKKSAAATDRRVKLAMDTAAAENRIKLLSDMERDYEGFSRAVRAVMRAGNRISGIHGPVAELMKTDAKYALAIEIALGAALQNIVVDREEDARNAIEFLKRQDAGRATFLPLTAIRGDELRAISGHEIGFVGLASRLIKFDEKYKNIFYNLLGRTVIVENLDQGIAIARKYQNAFRIVTLDGQVINRGGAMTGGSVSRGTGVLSRKAELDKLREQAVILRHDLDEAGILEEQAARDLAAARYELETAEETRRGLENQALRMEETRKHYENILPSLRENVKKLSDELDNLLEREAENKNKLAEYQEIIDKRKSEAASCGLRAEEVLSGQTELREELNKLSELISSERESLAGLNAEREAATRRAEDLRKLSRELSGGQEQKENALLLYHENIRDAEEKIKTRQDEMNKLKEQEKLYQRNLDILIHEKLEIEANRTAKNKESQDVNEKLLNLERLAARLEQKLNAAALEKKQILDKLWENYELTHSAALEQKIEIENINKASRRIGELKREIGKLGAVNMGAIEEFDEVNTRYSYLTGQRNDIEKAKVELEGIIQEITGQMTVIFDRQFKLLSESFQTTFVELFGGGTARLELEDENDILNCGIEIKAQPPGKTLKTISLLSGGEKAFVAIALYFSILKVHPTPFVVMDEIEAALDDVNVTRYARYMRNLTDHTQFIVITHRRGTMEEADVLYGVTMQEQGISKILTINLNDMSKELGIE